MRRHPLLRGCALASVVVAIMASSTPTRASDGLAERLARDWLAELLWTPVGIVTGFRLRDGEWVPCVGAELSAVVLTPSMAWFGAYVDGVWDLGVGESRFSMGPEAGWWFLGVDGGYVWRVRDAGSSHGVVGRVVFTGLALATLGMRVGYDLSEGGGGAPWLELNVLLKIPLPLSELGL